MQIKMSKSHQTRKLHLQKQIDTTFRGLLKLNDSSFGP